MPKTCIIIGASHAAAQLVASLRQEGWVGKILVIGDEASLPYHRPPLSKAFLTGEKNAEQILIRPKAAYDKASIEFMLGTHVNAIDSAHKKLKLNNGQVLAYDKLAFCTGSRVRKLDVPGCDYKGIYYLRDINDAEQIKSKAADTKYAVIVGGGYIGLETAAALRQQGLNVSVLEMLPRVLQRTSSPEVSGFFTRVHQDAGVIIKTGLTVSHFEHDGQGNVQSVVCGDNQYFQADLVVIGVGVIPNTELAESAGLDVDNGIVVNKYAQTTDPDIVAAGDCTSHPSALYNKLIRLESVPNAAEQAKSAAAAICGNDKEYTATPWFWSDQYDVKLQIAGLNHGYDKIVLRGEMDKSRSFVVFYLKGGALISADCINRPKEFMVCRRLVDAQPRIPEALLVDESIDPKTFLKYLD